MQKLTVSLPAVSDVPKIRVRTSLRSGRMSINPPLYIIIATCIITSSSLTVSFSPDSGTTVCNASETKEIVAVPSAYNGIHDHPMSRVRNEKNINTHNSLLRTLIIAIHQWLALFIPWSYPSLVRPSREPRGKVFQYRKHILIKECNWEFSNMKGEFE
jgi:hypothetical protein